MYDFKKTELLYNSVRENFTAVAAEADDDAVATSVMAEEEADADVDLENPDSVEVVSLPTVELTQTAADRPEDAEVNLPEVVEQAPVEARQVQKEPAATAVRNDTVNVEFTINDKFRFRRELFSNSDVDMSDALQIATRMNSREELEDYFYNDLCLDPENPVVVDFMRIIGRRFN